MSLAVNYRTGYVLVGNLSLQRYHASDGAWALTQSKQKNSGAAPPLSSPSFCHAPLALTAALLLLCSFVRCARLTEPFLSLLLVIAYPCTSCIDCRLITARLLLPCQSRQLSSLFVLVLDILRGPPASCPPPFDRQSRYGPCSPIMFASQPCHP